MRNEYPEDLDLRLQEMQDRADEAIARAKELLDAGDQEAADEQVIRGAELEAMIYLETPQILQIGVEPTEPQRWEIRDILNNYRHVKAIPSVGWLAGPLVSLFLSFGRTPVQGTDEYLEGFANLGIVCRDRLCKAGKPFDKINLKGLPIWWDGKPQLCGEAPLGTFWIRRIPIGSSGRIRFGDRPPASKLSSASVPV